MARAAHRISEAIVGNVAESVEVAVDKEHGLAQPSAIVSGVGVGDVGAIVQVPGVARAETGNAERFDQGVEVGGGPERWIGRHRRCLMRRTEPTPIAPDQGGPIDLPYGRGVPTPIDRREGRWNVSIEVSDRLVEVRQVEAVVIPLSIRILVGGIELAVD